MATERTMTRFQKRWMGEAERKVLGATKASGFSAWIRPTKHEWMCKGTSPFLSFGCAHVGCGNY